MWDSTIQAAQSKVQLFSPNACMMAAKGPEPDPLKVAQLVEALAAGAGFDPTHPPLVGVVVSAPVIGAKDGVARDEKIVILLTGRARLAAAEQGGFGVPIFPLEQAAIDDAVAAGLMNPDTFEAPDVGALALFWMRGKHATAGELLGDGLDLGGAAAALAPEWAKFAKDRVEELKAEGAITEQHVDVAGEEERKDS